MVDVKQFYILIGQACMQSLIGDYTAATSYMFFFNFLVRFLQ